jgi:hypothetical protein
MNLRSTILGFAAAVSLSIPAIAQERGGERLLWPDSGTALTYHYEQRAKALQAEFAAAKQSDGGTMTAEHLALFQQKLSDLLASYREELAKLDPNSVNADATQPR